MTMTNWTIDMYYSSIFLCINPLFGLIDDRWKWSCNPRGQVLPLSRMAELDFEVRQRGQQAALQRGKEDKERWSTDQKKYIYEVCCGCAHIRSWETADLILDPIEMDEPYRYGC